MQITELYLQENYSDIFTICDAKRGDIGSTNQGYVQAIFEYMNFDSVTVNPFVGKEGLLPFLEHEDKVTIILCHTSNEGAKELQEIIISDQKIELWQKIAEKVATDWNTKGNCMLVVGATYPEQLKKVREIVGDMWLLVPGIGSQGGELKKVLEKGSNSRRNGLIINSSRGIIFSNSPKNSAKQLATKISSFLDK